MKRLLALTLVLLAVACVQRPAPVGEVQTVEPAERLAIDVQYVVVPVMAVYAQPAFDAPRVGEYGLSEAISVLERKGDWTLIRTYDGAGWVKTSDLVSGAEMEKFQADKTPKFYIEPKPVPFSTRGEIVLQAKVNTDGYVVDVQTVKNTTGSAALASANAEALKAAQFYPIIDKGSRKFFTYEHVVYY